MSNISNEYFLYCSENFYNFQSHVNRLLKSEYEPHGNVSMTATYFCQLFKKKSNALSEKKSLTLSE